MLILSRAIILLLFFLLPNRLWAQDLPQVLINEVAWMGTNISANDEWIELYNNTGSPFSLESWVLRAADGAPEIQLKGEIPARGFFLLERTDDSTLPGITADQIYIGALQNTGEKLELFNDSGELIDTVDCGSGWFAGDNTTKQTMERIGSNWQTSQKPGGSPKEENTEQVKEVVQEDFPGGIIFSEILPSPLGQDALEEWIEIKNLNNKEIHLSGWQIRDQIGSITSYTMPEGTVIPGQGFLVFGRPETKITLNNEGDKLQLLQPNGQVIDEVSYEKTPRGESFNLTGSGWAWSASPTPGRANIVSALFVEKETIKTEGNQTEESAPKQQLAAVGEQVSKENPNSFLFFLIALAVAFLSGTVILTLKRKLKEQGINSS